MFEVLCSLEDFCHVFDILGVVRVELDKRLSVALSCGINFFTTLFNFLLQLLNLHFVSEIVSHYFQIKAGYHHGKKFGLLSYRSIADMLLEGIRVKL